MVLIDKILNKHNKKQVRKNSVEKKETLSKIKRNL